MNLREEWIKWYYEHEDDPYPTIVVNFCKEYATSIQEYDYLYAILMDGYEAG
jgi:hypothetical protein